MDVHQAESLLETIAQTGTRVTLGEWGYAAHVDEYLRAYRALIAEPRALAEVRATLDRMVASGSSGSRVYSALLLGSLDLERSRQVLESFLGSEEPCDLFRGGCCGIGVTLGAAAEQLLRNPPYGAPPRAVAQPQLRRTSLRERVVSWLGW